MKYALKVFFIGLLVYFAGPYLGWWWIAVAAFIGGALIKTPGIQSFFAGGFGVGLAWLWMTMKIDISTSSILTDKMAGIMGLGHRGFVIGITVILGGLVGALSSWTGHNFRKLFEGRRRGYYH